MIAVVGAFDENGVYGIGSHMPWEDENGRSGIRYDTGRFLYITRETAPQGKRNVLIAGRRTAETLGMRPLPGRRMVVVSRTLHEDEVNAGRGEEESITVAHGLSAAMEKALAFEDCGHVFFIGGYEVWQRALAFQLCTHAFITVIRCNTVARSIYKGDCHRAPDMLLAATFGGMDLVDSVTIVDSWGESEVELEFRNYARA
jgi:dihydrofolate reductase